jgi:hypothetical protein
VIDPSGEDGPIIPDMGKNKLDLIPEKYPPRALLAVLENGYGPAIF